MYRLFYNHENVGDVLFVVLDAHAYPDKSESKGDVTALYKDGKLIGVNLFNFTKTVKLKVQGMIVTPDDKLIDVINALLSAANVPALPYCRDSGYKIAVVKNIEEHPLDERSSILTLDLGDKELCTVTRYQNVEIGKPIVVAIDGCVKFDGTLFEKKVVRNIPIDCEVCCAADLRLGEEFKAAFIPETNIAGSDFFLQ